MAEDKEIESSPPAERRCARCSALVGARDRFCQECGAEFQPMAGRKCPSCGANLRSNAQFCPQCGTRTAIGRGRDLRAGWEQVRARAAAVDWTRLERAAVPIAGLLFAGLIGFGIGQNAGRSPAPPQRVVTAARGWRGGAESSGAQPVTGVRDGETSAGVGNPSAPEARPSLTPEPASHLTRFRDFHITASSWELANPPVLAVDGDPYTAWHAWETERFPEGDWLTVTFPTPRVVSRIGLIPGRIGPRAREDGRVRSILVKAPGAPPQKLVFQDRPQMQYRDLNHPVVTRTLLLRIVTVVPGTRSRHIIIPEIQVWGQPAPSQVAQRPGTP